MTEIPKNITEVNNSQEEINEIKNNTGLELKVLQEEIKFPEFLKLLVNDDKKGEIMNNGLNELLFRNLPKIIK